MQQTADPMTAQNAYPQLSDLIFGNAATSDFNKILGDIKRSTLSIPNRLRSIQQDADFVARVASIYDLPLVANERCGSWYINPSQKAESAYFKSTDGHMAQWSFSLRRLNLQVLDLVIKSGGCIIVDSTRRGKSMPDALSKTVPIWITVINRFFFPDQPDYHDVTTPPAVVGASEHAQIASRIPEFVDALKSLNLDLSDYRQTLRKPLRPVWLTQDSPLPTSTPAFSDFYPLVLLTSSRRVTGAEVSENNYIQGAADDAEAWANGLTAPLFWAHADSLLSCPEDEMVDLISRLRKDESRDVPELTLIRPTPSIYFGTLASAEAHAKSEDIVITVSPKPNSELQKRCGKNYIHTSLAEGKVGSRQLRHSLPKIISSIMPLLTNATASPRLVIADESGKDQGVCVALTVLCLFIDGEGNLKPKEDLKAQPEGLSKALVKQRLSWISVVRPDANPSRTTLQSVNAFLLG